MKTLRFTLSALALSLAAFLTLGVTQTQAFAGGDGSSGNPYQIANCTQLLSMYSFENYGLYYNKHYLLTTDIDCSAQGTIAPLYDNEEYDFRGTLDGDGHSIRNLNIFGVGYESGLFGVSTGGYFKDLFLDNITVDSNGESYAGALVGYAIASTIENVHARNIEILGESNVGGLVGRLRTFSGGTSTVTRSSASGSVSAPEGNAGGLIGRVSGEEGTTIVISESFANTALAAGNDHVGGFIGNISSDGAFITLTNNYAWGEIDAPSSNNVGGLIGMMFNGNNDVGGYINVRYSYAWNSSIIANEHVGGLVGIIYDPQNGEGDYSVLYSFASSALTANAPVGGLIGTNGVTGENGDLFVEEDYFDQDKAGASVCDSGGTLQSPECRAVNTDGNSPNHFVNGATDLYIEWDFETRWHMRETTPPTFIYQDTFPELDDGENEEDPDNGEEEEENDGNTEPQPRNSSRKSSRTRSATTCSAPNLVQDPDLFQIDTKNTSAVLYFSPVLEADHYFISYGEGNSTNVHAVRIDSPDNSGVVAYTINDLMPNSDYTFVVRAGRSCATSDWSNSLQIRSTNTPTALKIFYKGFVTRVLEALQ